MSFTSTVATWPNPKCASHPTTADSFSATASTKLRQRTTDGSSGSTSTWTAFGAALRKRESTIPSPIHSRRFSTSCSNATDFPSPESRWSTSRLREAQHREAHAFPKTPVRPTVYAYAGALPPEMTALAAGVKAITRPDMRWSRCDIKVISLIANVLANQEAKENGAFEAILIRDGVALEGTHTSFFGVKDGVVRTAPLSNFILPGITREITIEAALRAGIEVVEKPIAAGELASLDEMFITGTTTEVVPVVQLDGSPVGTGKPGETTLRIMELYRVAAGIA